MNAIRKATMSVAMLALTAGAAVAPPLTPASTADQVLDALHDRAATLNTLSADMTQTQLDVVSDTTTVYQGHLWLRLLNGGSGAQMHLRLDTKQKQKQPVVPWRIDYLLDKGWLTIRDQTNPAHPKQSRRAVVKPGGKLELFQVGKGPFPLPIGQDKAEVMAQFAVVVVPVAKDDPAGTIHLQLTPKPNTPMAKQYKTVDFWVDLRQRLPVKVETLNKGETDDQTYELTRPTVNAGVGDGDVALPPLPDNGLWKVEPDVPYGQAQ